jgi:hypothetical protein
MCVVERREKPMVEVLAAAVAGVGLGGFLLYAKYQMYLAFKA